MTKFAIQTLGCKVNQAEEEKIRHDLTSSGFIEVDFKNLADVYIINTCTVTHLADHKSRKFVRKARGNNSKALIVVAGCAVNNPASLKNLSGRLLFLNPSQKEKILNHILASGVNIKNIKPHKDFSFKRTRAMIKIQDGCNHLCSYCIVPFVRGKSSSLEPDSIIRQIRDLAEAGYKEAVLTGVNLNYYGKDLKEEIDLVGLVNRICEKTSIERIRISSLEPYNFDFRLIELVKNYPQICRHFHIPLQHASNRILKTMGRGYLIEDYKKIIDFIFDNIPDLTLTTDVIVGFPGEEEEDFAKLHSFVRNTDFYRIHVFKFSPRPHTRAFSLENKVKEEIKNQRSKIIINKTNLKMQAFEEKFIGKEMKVLVESHDGEGCLTGHTDNYLKVLLEKKDDIIGRVVKVRLKKRKNRLFGEVI